MTTTETRYAVIADSNAAGTPYEVLYSDARWVFATEAEARAAADAANSDELWGPDGDLTADEAGFSYDVVKVTRDELESLCRGHLDQW